MVNAVCKDCMKEENVGSVVNKTQRDHLGDSNAKDTKQLQ